MFLEKVRFLFRTVDGLNIVTVAKNSLKYSVLSIPVYAGFLDQQLCLCFPILARFTQWKKSWTDVLGEVHTFNLETNFHSELVMRTQVGEWFFFWKTSQGSNRQDVLAKQTTQATLGFAERNAEGYGFVTEDGHESGKGVSWGFLGPGGFPTGFWSVLVHVGTKLMPTNSIFREFVGGCCFFCFAFFFCDRFFFLLQKMGIGDFQKPSRGAVSCSAKICQIWVTQILKLTTDDWRTPSRSPLQIRDIVF